MKWPWNRTYEAEADARKARQQLEQVKAQWPDVRETVAVTRMHRELNGWTDTVKTIFEGGPRRA